MFRECEACIKKRSKFEDRNDSIVMARMGHSVEILRYSFILLHPDALLFSTVKAITPTMKIHQLHTDDKLSVPCICGQFIFFYLGGQSVSCKASLAALRLYGYFCDLCCVIIGK